MQKKIQTNGIMVVLLVAAMSMLAAPAMAEPAPFVLNGCVTDSNSDPCNDPWVRVTNVNTGVSWDADNSTTSNYYRLVLDSDDVNAGEITNSGAGTLDWNVTSDQMWIAVNPASGSDAGTVTVTADTAGLSDGAHRGMVTVSSNGGTKTVAEDVNVQPATGRMDEVTFYLNVSDGSHEISVIPGEEVTIYLDAYAPVNTTAGFEAGVMFDPDVLECLDVTENESVTNWMLMTFRGVWDSGLGDGKKYINFDALGFSGPPGLLRCGDIRVRAVNPGTTILYLGVTDVDIEDGDNNTIICDTKGDSKNWDLAETFTFTCLGEAEPRTPFVIDGYVNDSNSDPCNDPWVRVTNVNTGVSWGADNSTTSNYYRLMLDSDDMNAGEILRFDASDGTGSTSVTDHTVTQVEVDAGGFEYNIALESPSLDTVVSIGSTEGSVGDSVDVSINITNASSIGAMDIRVAYNASILYATNVANGSLIESLPAPLVAYHIGYIDVNISFVTFPETIDGDGELFIVTFDLIGGEAGDSSTLEIAAEAYRGSVPIVEVPVTTVNGVITVTGMPDTTPPVITDVANETPTSGSATITWTTDEGSDSLVKYGIDSDNYTDATADGAMTTSHVIQLSGLTPNTTYYFIVNSTDASGNTNESSEYSFTTMVMTEVGVAIDCATIGSDPSCRTTVNITLNGITDYGAGTIHLYYNESVVNLVAVGLGDSMRVINNSSSGLVKISAFNTDGLSGEVVFANVTFKPAGLTHGFSELNLTVETLYGRNYTALQTVISNCSISIGESNLPEVTAPAASPSVILNDTAQMRPRKPGTNITNLTVHVTDDTGVGSVYINLTPILGMGHDMVQMIGPDGQPSGDWYVVTNASYSSLTPYSLNVMAKDYHGNWENGTRITLDVRRRGDVRSSSMAADNKVDSGDYFYIARYTVGLDPAPDDLTAQIVTADSWDGIDMADALYIAMYEAYKPPYGDYEAP